MMKSTPTCDLIAERLALGEPLGELAEHAATCERCQLVTDLPGKLVATHHEVDPGLGFAARMTIGAQHRIAVRRRRRVAAGLGATALAGMLAVFAVTRTAGEPPQPSTTAGEDRKDPSAEAVHLDDADLKALVDLADTDRSSRISARWGHIKRPLSPYRKLLQGVLTP